MSSTSLSTRERILEKTREQLMQSGLSKLTLQRVADEVGMTKQAILYWFPSKSALLREIFVEALEREAAVLKEAVESAADAEEAVELFLRQGLEHHKANLPRFRLSYLAAQADPGISALWDDASSERVYAATDALYGELEKAFRSHRGFPREVNPRNFGVSLHMALLGHVCLYGSMEALNDSFKQSFEAMIEALAGVLCTGLKGDSSVERAAGESD